MEQETPLDSPTAGELVTVYADWDEWYPVYEITFDNRIRPRRTLQIPKELVERIQAAQAEFESVQNILCELVHPNGY